MKLLKRPHLSFFTTHHLLETPEESKTWNAIGCQALYDGWGRQLPWAGAPFSMIIAVENDWVPSVIVGGLLVVFGLLWMGSHIRAWRRERSDEKHDDFDQAHFANRFQRRMQTSGIVVLIGVLIPVGDIFVWGFGPWAATAYWLFVLVLALWVGAQAMGDLSSVQAYSRTATARVNSKRQELEAELAEYRRRRNNDK